LNALSPGMSEDALNVIEAYEADPAIRVLIMRGAGRKAFIKNATDTGCSGRPVSQTVHRVPVMNQLEYCLPIPSGSSPRTPCGILYFTGTLLPWRLH
jgi:hypothetical protein